MRIKPPARPARLLRLAPLVDVVFLLLVFFMLAARLDAPQAFSVSPPVQGHGTAHRGSVLIRLGADGRIDLNGLAIDSRELRAGLAPILSREPDTKVLIQAAFAASLQDLVQVLDSLRTAGADSPVLIAP